VRPLRLAQLAALPEVAAMGERWDKTKGEAKGQDKGAAVTIIGGGLVIDGTCGSADLSSLALSRFAGLELDWTALQGWLPSLVGGGK
jgi:hypothetical protein